MYFYKAHIINGQFHNISYEDISEGIAYERLVQQGFGYFSSNKLHNGLEQITEDEFNNER